MPNREDYQLRKLEKSDLEMVLNWRNSDRIRANMYTDYVISLEEHLAWYERIKSDKTCIYLICEYQTKPIGLIYFTNIDKNNSKCYWGFYLGEIDAPLGCGIVMEFLALEYIFENRDIRKLCCGVLSFNDKVVKLHKKFRFN
jgi:UDP-4-amino-4,6-dideoxy-N-acetyl-beta-L-altrosamine N-acetyltransferase